MQEIPSTTCLLTFTQTLPLSSVDFPCGLHSLPPYSYIAGVSDCWLSLQPPADASSLLTDFSTLKMKVIHYSETSVNPGSTQRHIPEDNILLKYVDYLYNYKIKKCALSRCNQRERAFAVPEGWRSNCIIISVTQQGNIGSHFVCGKVCQFLVFKIIFPCIGYAEF
jgi:hypothetical protein